MSKWSTTACLLATFLFCQLLAANESATAPSTPPTDSEGINKPTLISLSLKKKTASEAFTALIDATKSDSFFERKSILSLNTGSYSFEYHDKPLLGALIDMCLKTDTLVVQSGARWYIIPAAQDERLRGKICYQGRFAVISYGAKILKSRSMAPGSQTSISATIPLMVLAEPELQRVTCNQITIDKAIDDQGRNLSAVSKPPEVVKDQMPVTMPFRDQRIEISNLPMDAKLLKKLSGHMDIQFLAGTKEFKFDNILNCDAGTVLESGAMQLTIKKIDPPGPHTIDVTIALDSKDKVLSEYLKKIEGGPRAIGQLFKLSSKDDKQSVSFKARSMTDTELKPNEVTFMVALAAKGEKIPVIGSDALPYVNLKLSMPTMVKTISIPFDFNDISLENK